MFFNMVVVDGFLLEDRETPKSRTERRTMKQTDSEAGKQDDKDIDILTDSLMDR